MLLSIVLLTEILATIFCIHCIYGRKVKLDVKTAGVILVILAVLEVINTYQLEGIYSFAVYIILFIYCKLQFKSSAIDTVISFVLCMIVITSIQFICMMTTYYINIEPANIRDVVSSTMSLALSLILFPRCKLHKLQRSLCKNSRFIVVLLGFMCLIVMLILFCGRIYNGILADYFAFAIPAILMLLYSIFKWYSVQSEAARMKIEVQNTEEKSKDYEELLTNVRLRQHELKNHMAAIFSTHYTYKTYENLVRAQEEYCEKIMHENRYNSLLLLGNNILVGFLYEKFQEVEADGIELSYKVTTKIDKMDIPTYHVVEMLGILLDNAMEALKSYTDKRISFEVHELEMEYEFSIKNSSPYVSYDEMLQWFELERSEKGSGRGLGLYHLKCLCEEWKCDIGCKNIETEGSNWVEFTLKIGKADNK